MVRTLKTTRKSTAIRIVPRSEEMAANTATHTEEEARCAPHQGDRTPVPSEDRMSVPIPESEMEEVVVAQVEEEMAPLRALIASEEEEEEEEEDPSEDSDWEEPGEEWRWPYGEGPSHRGTTPGRELSPGYTPTDPAEREALGIPNTTEEYTPATPPSETQIPISPLPQLEPQIWRPMTGTSEMTPTEAQQYVEQRIEQTRRRARPWAQVEGSSEFPYGRNEAENVGPDPRTETIQGILRLTRAYMTDMESVIQNIQGRILYLQGSMTQVQQRLEEVAAFSGVSLNEEPDVAPPVRRRRTMGAEDYRNFFRAP